MGKQEELKQIVIYDAPGRKIEVQVCTESLWLSLTQVAVLFGVNKPAISKHLKNIYASKEIDKQATVSKMETVQTEGGRTVCLQNDIGLAALALLTAESNPRDKDAMIRPTMNMLTGEY